MRKYINTLLAPLGYELRRLDRFASYFDRLASSTKGVRFVQVGANDGVSFDTLYSKVTLHRCPGLVIEPLPDMFARLQHNYAAYPAVRPICCAVHATEAYVDLYRAAPASESLLPSWVSGSASFNRNHLVKHGVPDDCIVAERVACLPLMRLLEQHGFLDANVLQVDTEGYDAEVIKMIDFARFKPVLIKYEHMNLSSNDAQAAKSILKQVGYSVHKAGSDTIAYLKQ